jgi:hypothetical protein
VEDWVNDNYVASGGTGVNNKRPKSGLMAFGLRINLRDSKIKGGVLTTTP